MQEDVQEHQYRAERIEALIQEVSEFSDPHARAVTEELLQLLLDLYGEGLTRIFELTIETGTTSYALLKTFSNDELVGSLLLLHGLHPVDIETRILRALDNVRPTLNGGNVELISIVDGIARLRLQGNCSGCSSSTTTLKHTIEDAIHKAAPDLEDLVVEDITEASSQPARVAMPVLFVPSRRQKAHTNGHHEVKRNGTDARSLGDTMATPGE